MIELEYLLEAVRDEIKSSLSDVFQEDKSIRIMPDNRAPAYAGEEFIGIYGSSLINENRPEAISTHEVYSVNVSLTRRLIGIPNDYVGEGLYTYDSEITKLKPSILDRLRDIRNSIDGNFSVITTANNKLGSGECPFLTPLGVVSIDAQPKIVNEDHFYSQRSSGKQTKGFVVEIYFSGAQIVRVT